MTVHTFLAPETRKQYREKVYLLMARAALDLHRQVPLDITPAELVKWMIEKKPTWARSTWRLYKVAVAYHLDEVPTAEAQLARDRLLAEPQTGARRKTDRTSARKQKAIPPEDFAVLRQHLSVGEITETKRALSLYLVAGIVTGLRPSEWRQAQWIDHHEETGLPALLVANAKRTHGRGNGLHRTLHLGDVDEFLRRVIRAFTMEAAQAVTEGRFDTFKQSLARTLSRVVRRIWPNRKHHITLYSTRHQAAANFKLALDPSQVAALLGHASAATADTHYARRQHGRTALFPTSPKAETAIVPAPDPREVSTVRVAKPSPWKTDPENSEPPTQP